MDIKVHDRVGSTILKDDNIYPTIKHTLGTYEVIMRINSRLRAMLFIDFSFDVLALNVSFEKRGK